MTTTARELLQQAREALSRIANWGDGVRPGERHTIRTTAAEGLAAIDAHLSEPEPTAGTPLPPWTISSPDGRVWTGESPLRAAAAAQRDITDPVVAMQRINAMIEEEDAIRDAELAEAFERGKAAALSEPDAQQAAAQPVASFDTDAVYSRMWQLMPGWERGSREGAVAVALTAVRELLAATTPAGERSAGIHLFDRDEKRYSDNEVRKLIYGIEKSAKQFGLVMMVDPDGSMHLRAGERRTPAEPAHCMTWEVQPDGSTLPVRATPPSAQPGADQ